MICVAEEKAADAPKAQRVTFSKSLQKKYLKFKNQNPSLNLEINLFMVKHMIN